MPRYKLRLIGKGDYLLSEDGTYSFCADTADEAKEMFEEWDERPEFVHSFIARPRIVYKADVENGDAHEDAEPGDTTYDFLPDNGRELKDNEIRMWEVGTPQVMWSMRPLPPDPVKADTIPVGVSVYHPRLGSGKTVNLPRRLSAGRVMVDVEFRSGERRACSALTPSLSFLPTRGWPTYRYEVTVAGETFVGSREQCEAWRDVKVAAITDEWKAAHA